MESVRQHDERRNLEDFIFKTNLNEEEQKNNSIM